MQRVPVYLIASIALLFGALGCQGEEVADFATPIDIEQSALTLSTNPIQYAYDAAGRLIAVYDPNGNSAQYVYDAAGNILSITQYASTALALFDFSPRSGAVGAAVTITGSGFSTTAANNTVKFNGTAATVSSATAQQLLVTVPSAATTGTLSVTVSGTTKTSTATFTVGPTTPTISSFTPNFGSPNTVVTITGTGFQTTVADDAVTIGNQYVTVSSATVTQLSVAAQSSSGKVRVTTPFGTALSTQDFFQVPSGVTQSSVAFTGRLAVNGNVLPVSLSSSSQTALVLFDANVNDQIGMTVTGINTGGNGYGSVQALDEFGNVLGTWFASSPNAYFQVTGIDHAETCMLVITPANGATQFQANIQAASAVKGAITVDGGAVTFVASKPSQAGLYTFRPSSPSSLTVTLSNDTFPIGDPPGTVYDSLGNVVSGLSVSSSHDAATDLVNLSASPYQMNFVTNDGTTGQLVIRIVTDATGSAGTENGSAVTLNMNAYQHGRFTFSANANDYLGVGVTTLTTTPSTDVVLNFYDPNNNLLTYCDLFSAGSCSPGTLPSTGTYIVGIAPGSTSPTATVSLQLLLSTAETGTVTVGGSSVAFSTTRVGQDGLYTFTATSGQSATVALSSCSFSSGISAGLYDPSNNYVGAVSCPSGSTGSQTFSSLSAGTYTIKFIPSGTDTGSVTLSVH